MLPIGEMLALKIYQHKSSVLATLGYKHNLQETYYLNPIPVGLISNYFLWGPGGHQRLPLPSKIGPEVARKILESSKNHGLSYVSKCQEMCLATWLKTAQKSNVSLFFKQENR